MGRILNPKNFHIKAAVTKMLMCKPLIHSCLHPPAGIDMLSDLWTGAVIETSVGVVVIKARVIVIVD